MKRADVKCKGELFTTLCLGLGAIAVAPKVGQVARDAVDLVFRKE